MEMEQKASTAPIIIINAWEKQVRSLLNLPGTSKQHGVTLPSTRMQQLVEKAECIQEDISWLLFIKGMCPEDWTKPQWHQDEHSPLKQK